MWFLTRPPWTATDNHLALAPKRHHVGLFSSQGCRNGLPQGRPQENRASSEFKRAKLGFSVPLSHRIQETGLDQAEQTGRR
jgi:hypothetical protein